MQSISMLYLVQPHYAHHFAIDSCAVLALAPPIEATVALEAPDAGQIGLNACVTAVAVVAVVDGKRLAQPSLVDYFQCHLLGEMECQEWDKGVYYRYKNKLRRFVKQHFSIFFFI